jgi:hypothetical protein
VKFNDVGCRVQARGKLFRVYRSGLRVESLAGFGLVSDFGFGIRIYGLGIKVIGTWFRVQGFRFKVNGQGFRVYSLGIRVGVLGL